MWNTKKNKINKSFKENITSVVVQKHRWRCDRRCVRLAWLHMLLQHKQALVHPATLLDTLTLWHRHQPSQLRLALLCCKWLEPRKNHALDRLLAQSLLVTVCATLDQFSLWFSVWRRDHLRLEKKIIDNLFWVCKSVMLMKKNFCIFQNFYFCGVIFKNWSFGFCQSKLFLVKLFFFFCLIRQLAKWENSTHLPYFSLQNGPGLLIIFYSKFWNSHPLHQETRIKI